jgi:hypothetical protein
MIDNAIPCRTPAVVCQRPAARVSGFALGLPGILLAAGEGFELSILGSISASTMVSALKRRRPAGWGSTLYGAVTHPLLIPISSRHHQRARSLATADWRPEVFLGTEPAQFLVVQRDAPCVNRVEHLKDRCWRIGVSALEDQYRTFVSSHPEELQVIIHINGVELYARWDLHPNRYMLTFSIGPEPGVKLSVTLDRIVLSSSL